MLNEKQLKDLMQSRNGKVLLDYLDSEIAKVSDIGSSSDNEVDFRAQKKLCLKLREMKGYLESLKKQYTDEELESFE